MRFPFILRRLAIPLLNLPRPFKRSIVLCLDIALCIGSVWLAYYLRLNEWVNILTDPANHAQWAVAFSLALAIPLFVMNGFYRAIFRYSGLNALTVIAKVIAVYAALYASIFTILGVEGVPRTVGLIQPMVLLIAVGASRIFARYWLGGLYQKELKMANLPRVLIYGAGSAGRQLASALANSYEMRVVGFLDDNPRLRGSQINSLKIFHPERLKSVAERLNVTDVLLALPNINRHRRNEILETIQKAHLAVRTLPSVSELIQGKVQVSDLRELDIHDLLGREPVAPDPAIMSSIIVGQTVVVTGAGGSIGSELCRQILRLKPERLVLIEHGEFALYQIDQELRSLLALLDRTSPDQVKIIPFLANVQDEVRLAAVFSKFKPSTVFHAAAYKHVPLVEHNPIEGIRNNVFGTEVAARVAKNHGVRNFVLISTDKAVRPTNLMGASKRVSELILQALADQGGVTRFSMVRFGNVLGSSGSVVPLFRKQIRKGGPITLTHPDITRYFMTIPEAAQLVIQAGAMAKGGEVFVLDMGNSVKIMDLACRIVELSGLTVKTDTNPDGDIEIQTTGLRPGEKLYEELLIGNNPQPTDHPRIMRAHEEFMGWPEIQVALDKLRSACASHDVARVVEYIYQLVPGYSNSGGVVDWIYSTSGNSETSASTSVH